MKIRGTVQIEKKRKDGSVWLSPEMSNLVVLSENHGANIIIQRLGGNNQYSLNITHGDLGTDDTAPVNANTQLGDAQARAVGLKTQETTSSVTYRFFFPDGVLPNETYKEFGSFIDGGSSVSTGQMWNRLIFNVDYVKATGEDTTIRLTLSVDNE